MRYLYLHGFASGVHSGKARFFRDRFAARGIHLEIPDLEQGDFENLTVSGQLAFLERAIGGDEVCLIGSSMGGYLAALCAFRNASVQRLVLLAPAFGFPGRWIERLGAEMTERWQKSGFLDVFHYGDGRQRRVSWKLVEDGAQWPADPPFAQPALIFQGLHDAVVLPDCAQTFAAAHPNARLRLLDSDHQLTNAVETIWSESEPFLLK